MGLSFVAVFLFAGTLSTSEIVAAQAHGGTFTSSADIPTPSWYVVLLLPSFLIYVITMVGETDRIPFDLPEGEGELVGGFHTEYSSSLKFAMFILAEYINIFDASRRMATTLFLGGWRAPWPIIACGTGANTGWWPVLWFLVKIVLVVLLLRLAARLAAAGPLRPADGARLEGPHPGLPGAGSCWSPTVRGACAARAARQAPVCIAGRRRDRRASAALGDLVRFDTVNAAAQGGQDGRGRGRVRAAADEPTAGGFPVPPLDLPHYHGRSTPERRLRSEVTGDLIS